jgi:DivIVA domain-containing protein
MAAGRPTIISTDALVSSDEVRHKGFATAFRGFDTNEVRTFLARVADELRATHDRHMALERLLTEAERRAENPVLDEATLLGALGEETARIVRSAHEAATDLKAKAEENVERLLREANEEAARIRRDAEGLLTTRTDEADAAAAQIRESAQVWGDEVRTKARDEAESIIEESKRHGREMVEEAQALRVKILGDLTRRRRVAMVQVEQLRAGRERLIEAYRVVRHTLDEVTDELARAEAEARIAAEVAGHRAGDEAEPSPDELEMAASIAASLGATHGADGAADEPIATTTNPVVDVVSAEASAAVIERSVPVVDPVVAETTAPEPAPISVSVEPAPSSSARPPAPKPSIDPGPPDERRLSSLRILRRPKADQPVETPAGSIHDPVVGEGVRIIKAEPAAVTPPAPEEVLLEVPAGEPDLPTEAASDAADAPEADPTEVDALFARIRASRAAEVADAEEVLATPAPGDEIEAPPATDTSTEADTEPETQSETEDEAAVPDADESSLQRRDQLIDPVTQNLSRKLKRALQDDQNDLLDRLRTQRGKVSIELVGDADEHAGRFRLAAYDLLADAARAGTAFATAAEIVDSESVALPAIADVADELAQAITGPLRTRLEQALADAVAEEDDEQAVIERVGAAYREWKSQRIERLASDHTVAAFSRGAFSATSAGVSQRWVVDDVDGPCPDCDDNSLAGAVARGEAFPTGQQHPPAHPGCRCVLVPTPA